MSADIIDFFEYGPKYKATAPVPSGGALVIVLPVIRVERYAGPITQREMAAILRGERRRRDEGSRR